MSDITPFHLESNLRKIKTEYENQREKMPSEKEMSISKKSLSEFRNADDSPNLNHPTYDEQIFALNENLQFEFKKTKEMQK